MNEVNDLAKGLADTLLRAAEEHVAKAQMALDQTKAFVEIINNQVAAHAKQNADMVGRYKEFGEVMLNAHRILDGGPVSATPHRVVERREISDLARRGSFAGVAAGNVGKGAGIGTLDPSLTTDPKRDPDANYSARTPSGLQREMADLERFRVNRTNPGADRHDPSHDDLTGVDGNRAS